MEKERFSLLLLEPGEYYFEDYSCYLLENTKNENKHCAGRLKICSKSLVFVPNNISDALLKISLKDCTEITKMDNSRMKEERGKLMSVECKQYSEMLAGNRLSPYRFTNHVRQFVFSFNYAQVDDLLAHINQLHRATALPSAEYNQMIAAIAYGRQTRIKFDPMWLENLDEKIVLETFGSKITPLVVNPGRIVVSNINLYFQPMNNIEPNRFMKIAFSDIKRIVKRRFILQHVGLEIYCQENTNYDNHLYLTLKSEEGRDDLYRLILQQPSVNLKHNDQEIMTLQWQNGTISNYDYLLYINSLADRTFNDLTQYPVFPWVISDYTSNVLDLDNESTYRDLSKPIGALNPDRLNKLKERYKEMSHPKFLYGSHYSTPGFVLFYLVRKYPHYMLCLQNGRFDHPDRMFNSIPHVWNNVMRNMSDFKELLPEFYDVNAKGDFLLNVHGINFGFRHDGTKVGDVALPPWAHSPEDFVDKLRKALESDYVSSNLHNWIDLIFGYKQTGVHAELADNKFYYLCYEGAVDLDAIQDWNQRHALEVQIMEFGQIPKQVFKNAHASRFNKNTGINNLSKMMKSLGSCTLRKYSFSYWDGYVSYETHKDEITGLAISSNGQIVYSISRDTHMKMNQINQNNQNTSHSQQRSIKLSNMPLSSILLLPDEVTVIVASCDSTAIVYDIECARTIDVIRGHDDAISCMAWCHQSSYLITASWDCTVTVWQACIPWKPFRLNINILAQLQHDAKLTCISLSRDEKLMASGTESGGLFIWSLDSFKVTHKLNGHCSDITGISFSSGAERVISCSSDCTFKVYDLATGMQVYTRSLHQPLTCLLWDDSNVLIGTCDGTVVVWDLINNVMLKQVKCHSGKLNAMISSSDASILITAGQDHIVNVWKLH